MSLRVTLLSIYINKFVSRLSLYSNTSAVNHAITFGKSGHTVAANGLLMSARVWELDVSTTHFNDMTFGR